MTYISSSVSTTPTWDLGEAAPDSTRISSGVLATGAMLGLARLGLDLRETHINRNFLASHPDLKFFMVAPGTAGGGRALKDLKQELENQLKPLFGDNWQDHVVVFNDPNHAVRNNSLSTALDERTGLPTIVISYGGDGTQKHTARLVGMRAPILVREGGSSCDFRSALGRMKDIVTEVREGTVQTFNYAKVVAKDASGTTVHTDESIHCAVIGPAAKAWEHHKNLMSGLARIPFVGAQLASIPSFRVFGGYPVAFLEEGLHCFMGKDQPAYLTEISMNGKNTLENLPPQKSVVGVIAVAPRVSKVSTGIIGRGDTRAALLEWNPLIALPRLIGAALAAVQGKEMLGLCSETVSQPFQVQQQSNQIQSNVARLATTTPQPILVDGDAIVDPRGKYVLATQLEVTTSTEKAFQVIVPNRSSPLTLKRLAAKIPNPSTANWYAARGNSAAVLTLLLGGAIAGLAAYYASDTTDSGAQLAA